MNETDNIKEFEEMKEMWLELNKRVSILEEENRSLAKNVRENNFKSSKDRLVTRYKKFIILESLMVIFFPLIIFNNPEGVEKYRWITFSYWIFFFLMEAGIDFYLMTRIEKLDLYNTPISEIANEAGQIWRIHKLAIIVGLPIAIGAIILFALFVNANEFVLAGMAVGGVIGALIGIRQLLKFKSDYIILQH